MTGRLISYDPKYKQAFHDITMAWLAKDFTVEPQHTEMLTNPEEVLLKNGGEVFFIVEGEEAIGTVGMKNHGNGVYELTKMGVTDKGKGKGYGRLLGEAVIERFRKVGGKTLFLESNTMLTAAVALYEKLGFEMSEHPSGGEYLCTNCYMEWRGNNAE